MLFIHPANVSIPLGLSVAFAAAKINQGITGSQKVKGGDTPPVARLPPGKLDYYFTCLYDTIPRRQFMRYIIFFMILSIYPIQACAL